MADNTKNKAAISKEIITKVLRYVLGAFPVMAKVDIYRKRFNFTIELVSMP